MEEYTSPVAGSVRNYILAGTLATLLFYIIYRKGQGSHYRYPPGPVGLPIFGSLFSLLFTTKQQHEVVNEWTKKYGDVFSFKLLNVRIYILSNARMSHDVMGSLHMMNRMLVPVVKTLTGKGNAGIAFSNDEVWKEQRRFFLTVFRKADDGGSRFEDIIGAQAVRMLAEMENNNGLSFDPQPIIHTSIGNIITKIMTGVTYEYDNADFRRVMKHSNRVFDLIGPAGILTSVPLLAAIPSPSSRQLMKEWDGVYDFIRESIARHEAEFNRDREPTDFIDSYLQEMARRMDENEKGSFDPINLLVCSFDLLLAGWETSATTITWSLHTLASEPESQRRVRQEITDIVGGERPPQFSDRHHMPITMATIAECMRLRPAFDLHLPHVATQDCKVAEYDIPKGSVVTTNMWHIFQSSALWEEPLEFRPDRFLDEDGGFDRTREPMFFGTGRRICPGEQLARNEIFLFVTSILQRFTLSLAEGVPEDLPGRHGLTNQPNTYHIHAVKIG